MSKSLIINQRFKTEEEEEESRSDEDGYSNSRNNVAAAAAVRSKNEQAADQEREEVTNDYSSYYWQSIPDPPAMSFGSASADAAAAIHEDTIAAVEDSTVNNKTMMKKKKRLRDVTNQRLFEEENKDEQLLLASKKKKKKKRHQRRSLLLPSDNTYSSFAASHDAADDTEASSSRRDTDRIDGAIETGTRISTDIKCSSGGDINRHNNDVDHYTNNRSITNHNGDQQQQQRLIQLVREYCALPDTQRIKSKQIQQIQQLSTYPIPGQRFPIPILEKEDEQEVKQKQMDNNNNNKSGTKTMKSKFNQQFIQHIKPIVQQMETQKELDLADIQTATSCTVHRLKGGINCYMDCNTGEEVDCKEYQRRYLSWIERKRVDRLVLLNNDGLQEEGANKPSTPLQEEEDDDGETEEENASCCCESSSFDMDQSVNMDDSMSSSLPSPPVHDDTTATDDVAILPTAKGTAALDAAPTSANTATAKKLFASSSKNNDVSGKSSSTAISSGLPISMSPSNNARVLEARKKLWSAIDEALANYSKEIIAIEQEEKERGARST